MEYYSLREFGHIYSEENGPVPPSVDACVVPAHAFESLLQAALLRQGGEEKEFLKLRSSHGRRCIQVVNYVGTFQVPGCQIEVLPKTTLEEEDPIPTRRLLWRMLCVVHNVPPIEADRASLNTLRDNWLEAMIRLFLRESSQLVRRGLRSQYVRVQLEGPFLRGQLQINDQISQRPGRQHLFHVSFDQYVKDRAENRLLKSCLLRLNSWTRDFENKRLARELLFVLDEIPGSNNVHDDLARWSTDRSMVHYQRLLPWIRLILADQSPAFARGGVSGISLLFPMEKLFEDYVAIMLRRHLVPGFRLRTQIGSEYLVESHQNRRMFQLRPDIGIFRAKEVVAILDTKWKLLDSGPNSSVEKYGISQADMYQLFAYGEKYLAGSGDLIVIYPAHRQFCEPLPEFVYRGDLRLWVVPFDLTSGDLIGAVDQCGCDWLVSAQ